MKDDPEEIASIMNLILPIDEQLPSVNEDFKKKFFKDEENGIISIRPEKIQELKKIFKGRVSYLKSMESNVTKNFMGEPVGELTHFKIVEDLMSDFQAKYYKEALVKDGSEKGVYTYSRQASLFVFPDGSYGSVGFDKYIKRTEKTGLFGDKKNRSYSYALSNEFIKEIKGSSDQETLKKIRKCSSKYADSIEQILKCYEENKSSFIYCEFVRGSGAILFSLLLHLFGFVKARGNETTEEKRYAIITNKTATQREIKDVINTFNKSTNINGKIISVVIGSSVISEGFSLNNIQSEQILTPWFNYSEIAQAIARGTRLGSHNDLLKTGYNPRIDIFQRVSVLKDSSFSVDLYMYELSEKKDINIKHIERIIKESAFDCALNYERNHVEGYDYQRECDYTLCDYKCEGVSSIDNIEELDLSTYQLYYMSKEIKIIIEKVRELYRNNFKLNLETLINTFDYSKFQILTSLRIMINENYVIYNKYGLPSYLREEKNMFFLVDSLSVMSNFFSNYYTKNPNVETSEIFSNIVDEMFINSIPDMINKLLSSDNEEEIVEILNNIPIDVQQIILESCIVAREKNIDINRTARDIILNYFKDFYEKISDKWIVWLTYDETDTLKCLENLDSNYWNNCSEQDVKNLKDKRQKIQTETESNPYGYYGKINPTTGAFCIVNVKQTKEGDKRTENTGKVCKTWDKGDVVNLNTNVFKIPPPNPLPKDFIKKVDTKEKILDLIHKKKVTNLILPNATDDDLLRLAYWGNLKKEGSCDALKKWLDENKLLVTDIGCGEGQDTKIRKEGEPKTKKSKKKSKKTKN